jgi:hypothetical protein
MNGGFPIDSRLERQLAETPTSRAPDRLRADIVTATSRQRQRPPWLTSLKEPPMRFRSKVVAGSPALRLAAVLAVTMALLLAVAGAVIAGASPQPSVVPAATAAPTWVTGHVAPAPSCTFAKVVVVDGVVRDWGTECAPQRWTASDPRLTGTVSRRWNRDGYQTDAGMYAFGTGAADLQNDGGSWACSTIGLENWGDEALTEGSADVSFTCVGDGGYAGLSAMLVLTDVGGNAEDFVGLLVAGDFPPVPGPPAVE